MPITQIQITGDDLHGAEDQNRPPIKIGGFAYATTPSAVLPGQRVAAFFDLEGYQHIKIDGTVAVSGAGGGSQYTEGTVTTSAIGNLMLAKGPSSTLTALQIFQLTIGSHALKVGISDAQGNLISSFGGGTQYTEGTATTAAIGTLSLAEGAANVLRPIQVFELTTSIYAVKTAIVDSTGAHIVNFGSSTVAISNTVTTLAFQGGAPWSVALTGTAAVTQSTSPWSVALTGTAAVTQSTSPWVVALTSSSVSITGTVTTFDIQTLTDNLGFTDGTSKLFGAGYIFDEVAGTALTENDAAAARIDAKRAQIFVIEDGTTRGTRAAVRTPTANDLVATSLASLCVLNSNYLFDGATWDAQKGDSVNGADMGGNLAHDAAEVTGAKPVGIGYQARTTNPTAVADADRVRGIADKIGRQVVRIGHVRDLITSATVLANTTASTTLLASGGANVFHDLISLDLSNHSQFSALVSLIDNSTTAAVFAIAPKQTLMKNWVRPLNAASTNTSWLIQLDTAASIYLTVQAEKNV